MQSIRFHGQARTSICLLASRSTTHKDLTINRRYKSDKQAADENQDIKSYYYPNTDVGVKERTVKPDGPPEKPLQTPYPPFPGGKNPKTGEAGGPTGPEPTRFGDWERKGRVTDF